MRGADQVDGDDRLRGGLGRGQTGGVDHVHHQAELLGGGGEGVDGGPVGDVDVCGLNREAGSLQRVRGSGGSIRVAVGQQDGATDTDTARDGLAHRAGADHNDDLDSRSGGHKGFLRWTEPLQPPDSLVLLITTLPEIGIPVGVPATPPNSTAPRTQHHRGRACDAGRHDGTGT